MEAATVRERLMRSEPRAVVRNVAPHVLFSTQTGGEFDE